MHRERLIQVLCSRLAELEFALLADKSGEELPGEWAACATRCGGTRPSEVVLSRKVIAAAIVYVGARLLRSSQQTVVKVLNNVCN